MLLVYYSSKSGNTKKFAEKVDATAISVASYLRYYQDGLYPPFVLVCPTYSGGTGYKPVPKPVIEFLNKHKEKIKGVVGTGNTNFGASYCKAADVISEKCNVPILAKVEVTGTKEDVELTRKKISELL